ncbi:hypothetical protein AGMMS49525_03580 [Bacteroidia bacterium]|nr:hypothetical protein AGMMS49525_03580 [Bacteroidia bacterium]
MGTGGIPTFRALTPEDIPTLNQSTTGTAGYAFALAPDADKTKLDGIETGATKNSPPLTPPKIANGTGTVGTVNDGYAYANHVHPTEVQNELNTASTTMAPSVDIVNDSLAVKLNRTSQFGLTGDVLVSSANIGNESFAATLKNSGVTSGAYGETAAQSPPWGGTFSVPSFTVDANGRVTLAGSHTVKIQDSIPVTRFSGIIADRSLANVGTSNGYGPNYDLTLLYGGTFSVPYIYTDVKGRVAAASTKTMTLPTHVDSISVNSAATATHGGIITTAPAPIAGSGNVSISAYVPLATDTTAGAMSAIDKKRLEQMTGLRVGWRKSALSPKKHPPHIACG